MAHSAAANGGTNNSAACAAVGGGLPVATVVINIPIGPMQAAAIAASTILPYVPGIATTYMAIHRQFHDSPRTVSSGFHAVANSVSEMASAITTSVTKPRSSTNSGRAFLLRESRNIDMPTAKMTPAASG